MANVFRALADNIDYIINVIRLYLAIFFHVVIMESGVDSIEAKYLLQVLVIDEASAFMIRIFVLYFVHDQAMMLPNHDS